MIERFLKLMTFVAPILLANPRAPKMLSAAELQLAHNIIKILGPIEKVSREICDEKNATASKIIPIVNCLITEMKSVELNFPEAITMQKTALTNINKRFGAAEKVNILAMATILDPRFKKNHFKDHLACSQAILSINKLIQELDSNLPEQEVLETEQMQTESAEDIWRHH